MDQSPGEALRAAMEAFGAKGDGALPAFLALYDEEAEFQDPLVHLHGRPALAAALRTLLERTRSLRVECGELTEGGGTLFLAWRMTLALKVGPTLVVDGVTHARTRAGRVTWQRDHWDLLSSAAGAVPLVGAVYQRLAALLLG